MIYSNLESYLPFHIKDELTIYIVITNSLSTAVLVL
jgi:hypothetical protein